MGKLSSGFAGSSTRGMNEFDKMVENRFEDTQPGVPVKGTGPYAKKHDDIVPEADSQFMAAAGKASDQEGLDDIDATEDKFQKPIKKPEDQFPGRLKMDDKDKKLTSEDGPEAFHKEMEKRMVRMASKETRNYKGVDVILTGQPGRNGHDPFWSWDCPELGISGHGGTNSADVYSAAKKAIDESIKDRDNNNNR